ncbi:MAG: hypothetical protein QNJ12_20500 [Ilumatobacter sp.]|uniref:hypothetical protein n=1 Tax=Ilumatobacter sp. TaxID=1967498 RepID=UPI0026217147|nr:hypothetical protein [Ilumatobacter sp.]MDJ0771180.1 hypothetical protein [Ilumatobacter sp.]
MSGAAIVILLVIAVVIMAVAIGALLARDRRRPEPDAAPKPAEPPPMTDLESALDQVTDTSGRKMSERLDAETDHVEDLRVPDDTGPLLRRALDHVESEPPTAEPPTDPSRSAESAGQVDPPGSSDPAEPTGPA